MQGLHGEQAGKDKAAWGNADPRDTYKSIGIRNNGLDSQATKVQRTSYEHRIRLDIGSRRQTN